VHRVKSQNTHRVIVILKINNNIIYSIDIDKYSKICTQAMVTEYLTKEKNKFDSERYEWLKESLRWYRQYILGLIFVFFITDVGKLLIGEPRPHFLDTCLPKEANNCTNR